MHSDGLHDLGFSSINIRVIKYKGMRWAGHVAHMGERKVHTGFWLRNLKKRRPLGIPRCKWEDNINPLNTKRRLLYLKT